LLLEKGIIHPQAPAYLVPKLKAILFKHRGVFACGAEDLYIPAYFEPISLLSSIPPEKRGTVRNKVRRRYGPMESRAIDAQIEIWLKSCIIEKADCSAPDLILSPLLTVLKKDHTFRVCLDPRPLNSITTLDVTPLPLVTDILDQLHGSTCFSCLDLAQGYLQLPLHPDSRNLVAFMTEAGPFRFTRLPFGLRNACSLFNGRLREAEQQAGLSSVVARYFDDFTPHSATADLHLAVLEKVLTFLRQRNFKRPSQLAKVLVPLPLNPAFGTRRRRNWPPL